MAWAATQVAGCQEVVPPIGKNYSHANRRRRRSEARIDKMEQLRRAHGASPIAEAESSVLRLSIGYGYQPMWAFWEIFGLSTLGWILYRRSYLAGGIAPTDSEAYKEFKAAGHTTGSCPRPPP